MGRKITLVLQRQTRLNLHQFCLTRDSKYGLIEKDRNAIWLYFATIWLYLALLFIMSLQCISVSSTSILLLHYNIPNIVIQPTLWTLDQRKRERRNTYVHKDSIFVKWHHVGFLRWDKSGRDRKKRNNLMQPTWVKNKFVRV